jgi:hypothetical protein
LHCAILAALSKAQDWKAGALFALGLLKPHLFLAVLFWLLCARRWRVSSPAFSWERFSPWRSALGCLAPTYSGANGTACNRRYIGRKKWRKLLS